MANLEAINYFALTRSAQKRISQQRIKTPITSDAFFSELLFEPKVFVHLIIKDLQGFKFNNYFNYMTFLFYYCL